LRKRLSNEPAVTLFSEAEALVACEAILARPPRVLVLDPTFAMTARGAALVSHVRADPRLVSLDVRVLTQDDTRFPVILDAQMASAEASLIKASQPLDYCGTRRDARFPMPGHVEATVNGDQTQLIDLSVAGAQLLAPKRLRPDQSVRVTLLDEAAETRLRAIVAWSHAEMVRTRIWYRAGVTFIDPDAAILEAFCVRHGATPDRLLAGS
jgi:hypothetical protein